MTARLSRLWAMAVKELLVVLLDRQGRIMLLVAPVLQLTLFGFASTLEVKAIDMGYVNRDAGIVAERVLVPLMLLSGYASPVDNMPGWLQVVAQANPVMHMLVICEGIFLKDMDAESVMAHTWPMLVAGAVTLALAARLFRLRSV